MNAHERVRLQRNTSYEHPPDQKPTDHMWDVEILTLGGWRKLTTARGHATALELGDLVRDAIDAGMTDARSIGWDKGVEAVAQAAKERQP